jgi:hypothetical protein
MLQDLHATVGWATGRHGGHAASRAVSARWHEDEKCSSTRGGGARCVHRCWRPSGAAVRAHVRAATSTGRLPGRLTPRLYSAAVPAVITAGAYQQQQHGTRYFPRVTPNATVLLYVWDFKHLISQQVYRLMATRKILLCHNVTNCPFFKTRNWMCRLLDL